MPGGLSSSMLGQSRRLRDSGLRRNMISVRNLTKTYRVARKAPGFIASMKSLVSRTYEEVQAVREISFSIAAGERVGFLGPNGAGKTTTLKMLAGLLTPTSGEVTVIGLSP